MAEDQLNDRPPIGADPIVIDGAEAAEVTGMAIAAVAPPLGGEAALRNAVSLAVGADLPQVGQMSRSKDQHIMLLSLQPDQVFVLAENDGAATLDMFTTSIGNAAYVTDQSDGWAVVRISGPRSREALERICPIDLDPDLFGIGAVARTLMEHLGVTILREDEDAYLLMSARSSGLSFWHAIETSLRNIA